MSTARTAAVCHRSLAMLIAFGWMVGMAASVHAEDQGLRSGLDTISMQAAAPILQSTTVDVFAEEMLAAHNAIRVEHRLPLLQWSRNLAAFARKWADALIAANRVAHNPRSPYGENILMTRPGSNPSAVVAAWAAESRFFTYSSHKCQGDCGHYTQLVWRRTREVGCAQARDSQREIWVCSYDPPGNMRGQRPY